VSYFVVNMFQILCTENYDIAVNLSLISDPISADVFPFCVKCIASAASSKFR